MNISPELLVPPMRANMKAVSSNRSAGYIGAMLNATYLVTEWAGILYDRKECAIKTLERNGEIIVPR